MVFVVITLTASLILNLAVLALLKIGLRGSSAAGHWAGRQPC
jgi:hypothetical protein